jgi:hypothetical protein
MTENHFRLENCPERFGTVDCKNEFKREECECEPAKDCSEIE